MMLMFTEGNFNVYKIVIKSNNDGSGNSSDNCINPIY